MSEATPAPIDADTLKSPPPWSYRIEAWGARLLFAAMGALPLDAASALGGAAARWIGPRLGVSNRARRNLRALMPELSAERVEAIVRGMWDNLGRVAAEYPHLPSIRVFGPESRVEIRGLEHLEQALAAGRRLFWFAGHLGNWEIGPLAAEQYGLDVAHFFRAANNPLIDRMIVSRRGGEMIPKGPAGSRRVLAAARRGAHFGMLVDQKLNEGIAVPFFGRPAMTNPGLAQLALRFNCAVLPAQVERLQGARFRLTIHPPLELPNSGDRDADIAALTTAVNATLETWIRGRPEQWFWLHNRWPG